MYFKAVDAVGNESEYATILLRIDKSAPSNVMSVYSDTPGANYWHKELTLKFDLGDSLSGVSSAKYCITTNTDCDPDTLASISNNSYTVSLGNNQYPQKVCSNATDNVGNTSEKYCSEAAGVDNKEPIIKSVNNPTNGNWTSENFQVQIVLDEAHSGIDYCSYSYDGGKTFTRDNGVLKNNVYTTTDFGAEGERDAVLKCTDKAGNESNMSGTPIRIDKTNPTAKIKAEVDDCNFGIKVSAEGSKDGESGIWKIQYRLNGGQWYGTGTSTTYNFTNVSSGTHTVYVKVTDRVGRETEASTTVTISSITLTEKIKQCVPKITSGEGLYEVSHSSANITYTSNTTYINNLKQTELRYAGSNPNNYVRFNGEIWRIIGLVNTPEGQRVKIIRNESIGEYSWDSSPSSVNGGCGVNEWSQADLMTLLNNRAYYNRTNGTCYNGLKNQTISCDFSSTGLTTIARNMIDTVTWNLGSNPLVGNFSLTPGEWYNAERGNKIGKRCNSGSNCDDSVGRTLTWKGKVGLMYPSDYGYATSNRSCLTKYMDSTSTWNSSCYSNDWLYKSDGFQWTITPYAIATVANDVFIVDNHFNFYVGIASFPGASFPTVYLLSDVKVTAGNGSLFMPFVLSL